MRRMNFQTTKAEMDTIMQIADRAIGVAHGQGIRLNKMDMVMDLSAVHANAYRLRLDELLAADPLNFTHDVFGIVRHLNRDTGLLENFFVPRFTAKAAKPTSWESIPFGGRMERIELPEKSV